MELEQKNKVTIEDLVFGISSLQVSALTHAAKLSPLVSGCTLGPKSNCNKENLNKSPKVSKNEEHKKNSHDVKKESRKSNESDRKVLDFNVFNNTALLRSVEKKRKDEVKRDLFQRKELIKSEEKKRMLAFEKCAQEQEKWIAGKVEIDKQIVEEVEDFAKTTSEESKKYFENLRREEEKKLRRISFDVIAFYQKGFKGFYEKIARLLPSIDKKRFTKMEEYNKLLKVLIINFENLKMKIRNEDIGPTEVKFAANLLTNIEMIYSKLCQEAQKLNDEAQKLNDEARQAEEQKRLAEMNNAVTNSNILNNEQQQVKEIGTEVLDGVVKAEPKETTIDKNLTNLLKPFVSSDCLEFYKELVCLYQAKIENYNRLMSDENMKKTRSAWQKAINIPINTISAVSPQHLQDKFDKIYSFISGNMPKTVDNPVSPADHPLGKDFCLVLLAKKFVSQGETAVSSNAQAAFPIAAIIVALWQRVPEFGKLFLACTYQECPYLIPYFIPQFRNQTAEEYYRVLGYRIVDGALEKQDMYLKRQSGIARLYSAVMITHPRQNFGPNPWGIEHGWKWLCNILNLDPLPDICATVILEFLQTAGPSMWAAYSKQFSKILLLMQFRYIAKLSQVDEGGPKARLEVFLAKVLREGRIEEPSGALPKNFW